MAFKLENTKAEKSKTKAFDLDGLLKKEIELFGKSFNSKKKEAFYIELSVLLKAGISLKEGLQLLSESAKKRSEKLLFEEIIQQIINGKSLSEAIATNKQFSEYEFFSLKIGEETGTLYKVTEELGAYYTRKNEQRRTLISALTYPIIVLGTAFLVVFFMLKYVVPMFQDIFKQNRVDLPPITEAIISISKGLETYGWLLLPTIAILLIIRYINKKKQWYRKLTDSTLLRFPYLGQFIRKVYMARFTQAVSLLTASKVPVLNSIQLVKKMVDFYPLEDALESVESNILKGRSLSESLQQHSIFDNKMISLVRVSEETNQTEFIFQRLNQQYNTEVQQQSKTLTTVLEPFIILIVGIIVGVILVAMYLPMFSLGTAIG
ncbi:type II secretion system F family protein [Spongiivirga citrea]|uniref:Type II secretion system F family protein n=1 Tax=Spongiivirga citrea TaxID=1481457 RepID=A0A6M0CH28_9FLAO|nr:type II secretion system F family protein [Spongiivirga citrea]NER16792.1 type II secretion system F family protein [Spongiivirga citrea]